MKKRGPAELLLGGSLLVGAIGSWWGGLSDGAWIDEVISLETAALPWPELLARTAFGDVHPPGYYTLLKGWALVGGGGELAGRGLSLCLVAAALWVLVDHGRRHLSLLQAALLGVLFASCPLVAHYATEIRSYGLLLLLATVGLVLVHRLERSPEERTTVPGLCLVVASLVWTHYFGWILVALLVMTTLLRLPPGRRSVHRWTLVGLSALAASSCWLVVVLVQIRHLPSRPSLWANRPSRTPPPHKRRYGTSSRPLRPLTARRRR